MAKKFSEKEVQRLLVDIDRKADLEDRDNIAKNLKSHLGEIKAYNKQLRRRGENQLADFYDGLVHEKIGGKPKRGMQGAYALHKSFKPSLKSKYSFTAPSMHGAFQILGYLLVVGGLAGILYLGWKIQTQVKDNVNLDKKMDQYKEYYQNSNK